MAYGEAEAVEVGGDDAETDASNPGMVACHIVFEQPGGAAGIVAELANCAGIDQKVMKS